VSDALHDTFVGEAADTPRERRNKWLQLLERSGIDPEEVGKVTQMKTWQSFHKDEDGNAVVTDLYGAVISPVWADGPEWPVVNVATPIRVTPSRTKAHKPEGFKTTVLLPDPQIGFRRYQDGSLDPMHDVRAMDVALKVLAYIRPDEVGNLGDYLDIAEASRFAQEAFFQMTMQPTVDVGYRFLAMQRALAPEADIFLHEGNHDVRLSRFIVKNAMMAYGLRRADEPDSWPVMSVPNLLRLGELGVNYIDGYPADKRWITKGLKTIHGKVAKKKGTAAQVSWDESVSTIQGHIHRIEQAWTTRDTDDAGPREIMAASPGCLCRIDGAVPSFQSGIDGLGRPVKQYENWQHGMAVVYSRPDGFFHYEQLHIQDGRVFFDKQVFEADDAPNWV
jgi:hypothetical protein